jgi:hypothetical protein
MKEENCPCEEESNFTGITKDCSCICHESRFTHLECEKIIQDMEICT